MKTPLIFVHFQMQEINRHIFKLLKRKHFPKLSVKFNRHLIKWVTISLKQNISKTKNHHLLLCRLRYKKHSLNKIILFPLKYLLSFGDYTIRYEIKNRVHFSTLNLLKNIFIISLHFFFLAFRKKNYHSMQTNAF